MNSKSITLADAAVRIGMNRERLLRLVQARKIEGRRNITGRWEVLRVSLDRFCGEATRR